MVHQLHPAKRSNTQRASHLKILQVETVVRGRGLDLVQGDALKLGPCHEVLGNQLCFIGFNLVVLCLLLLEYVLYQSH